MLVIMWKWGQTCRMPYFRNTIYHIILDANVCSNCLPFALTDINEEGIWLG